MSNELSIPDRFMIAQIVMKRSKTLKDRSQTFMERSWDDQERGTVNGCNTERIAATRYVRARVKKSFGTN
jgi:hypothetical protein